MSSFNFAKAVRVLGILLLGVVIGLILGRKANIAPILDWGSRIGQGEALGKSWISTSEMVVLGQGESIGILPSGLVLYSVPDPWGDKTSRFKIYLQSLSSDEMPLTADRQLRAGEKVVFWIKPFSWLNDSNDLSPLLVPRHLCSELSSPTKE